MGFKVNYNIPLVTARKRPVDSNSKDGNQTTFLAMLLFSNDDETTLGWFENIVGGETITFPFEVSKSFYILILLFISYRVSIQIPKKKFPLVHLDVILIISLG
jgi:hypothetical protein